MMIIRGRRKILWESKQDKRIKFKVFFVPWEVDRKKKVYRLACLSIFPEKGKEEENF